MTRTVCPAAIDLIKRAESLELTAYFCPAGIPSIGYGSSKGVTAADVRNKRTITVAEAEARLVEDVAYAADQVAKAVKVPLTDNQFGALVSFCYNTGPGAKGVKSGFVTLKEGGPSTMLRKLNEGRYDLAAGEFPKWIYAGKTKLKGLVTRRAAEKALFLTPDGQEVTVPEPASQNTPAKPKTEQVSKVGSGAAVSALAGAPTAWLIASLWNALFPDNPMPLEVAISLGSVVGTLFYLGTDYLSRRKVQVEPTL